MEHTLHPLQIMTIRTTEKVAMTFEEFIIYTRPKYLVFLDRDENGQFINEKTRVLEAAWLLGYNEAPFTDLEALLTDANIKDFSIDFRDSKCFLNNRTQRHYWCYISGRKEKAGFYNIPFLTELFDTLQ